MIPERERVDEVVGRMRATFGAPPAIAVVLGSGLGGLVAAMTDTARTPYPELGLPQSTVPGHAGELVVGSLRGKRVAALAGRVHLYEGREPAEVVRYVRALHGWGVRALLLTNSVGGITAGLDPGALVLVTDHLNFQGQNPLYGPPFGERFPDLSRAYDSELRALVAASAASAGIRVHTGVLAASMGPSYETPAEIRMLGLLGADVVGMSTVPEVIAAAEVGLRCAVISLVSNRAAGLSAGPLTHDEVTQEARRSGDAFVEVLARTIAAFD